jgi:Ca2+-binding RTX toxin-like protein
VTATIWDNDPTVILHEGLSNDTYTVTHTSDRIIEVPDGGTDRVLASVSYTLGANVENLTLTGAAAINGTGNALGNVIVGNGAANVLHGGAGNDALSSGGGADTMVGGTDNDTYWVDNAGDVVTENPGEGSDTVRTTLLSYTLGANLENLTFIGVGSFGGTGNSLNNVITGGAGNDVLNGLSGNDVLLGGGGQDSLTGGVEADFFKFAAITDSNVGIPDIITDFSQGLDKIDLSGIDANPGLSGNQAFNFVGTSPFSGAAGELRYQASGGNTHVFGSVNGGTADLEILLSGAYTLQASNFNL